jgi:AraC-like DNA-binding protein
VERLWYSDDSHSPVERAARERVLPTGCASLVVRLSEHPVRVFAGIDAPLAQSHGFAVLGGTRSRFYVRDTSQASISLGAQFRPGAAAAWLGVPGEAFAEAHIALEELWGAEVARLRERLLRATTPYERLAQFELELGARAVQARAIHPVVEHALQQLGDCRGSASVDAAWRASGFSQRHFIALFRREVGLAPKVFARIQRFQAVLRGSTRAAPSRWAEIAASAGYADQAHLVREFQAIAGIAPGRYRPLVDRPHHVPAAARAAR